MRGLPLQGDIDATLKFNGHYQIEKIEPYANSKNTLCHEGPLYETESYSLSALDTGQKF